MRATLILGAALLAAASCGLAIGQMNDDCGNATPIAGEGIFPFDNTAATEDGPANDKAARITRDVWFCWTAPCDGPVRVSTCGGTDVDTKIAVYKGCDCPPPTTAVVAWDDDSCGFQAQVSFVAESGQDYLIRVGSYPGTAGGAGTLTVECLEIPANVACAAAGLIECDTLVQIDNTAATYADVTIPTIGCTRGGHKIVGPLWYKFVATDTSARISTRGAPRGDTLLAVYDACGGDEIGCSDDMPEWGDSPHPQRLSLHADVCVEGLVPGQEYHVLFTTYRESEGGYELRAECPCPVLPPPPCAQPEEDCQRALGSDALLSVRSEAYAADDFTPAADGAVSAICWWGVCFDGAAECAPPVSDAFEVRYYEDAGGLPGALLAIFSQAAGTLTVTGPIPTGLLVADLAAEYEYAGTHDPVAVSAGQCYWLEITNAGTACFWYWATAQDGDQRALHDVAPDAYDPTDAQLADLAFCLDVELGDTSACVPPPPEPICAEPPQNCQPPNVYYGGLESTRGGYTAAADDFIAAQYDEITGVCWWGAFLADSDECGDAAANAGFEVRYYADDDGKPGAPLARFAGADGTLTLTGVQRTGRLLAGAYAEEEYTATHAPLPVRQNQRYWIEISNAADGGCPWVWEYAELDAGNDLAAWNRFSPEDYTRADLVFTDLAFCLTVEFGDSGAWGAPPANDDCVDAAMISPNTLVAADNTFATENATDPPLNCSYRIDVGTIWYKFVATHTSALVTTRMNAAGDTVVGVYAGNCGNLTELACNDDKAVLRSEVCVQNLTVGATYYVQVAAYNDSSRGVFDLMVVSPCPGAPANDLCAGAIGPLAVPSATAGTTLAATIDDWIEWSVVDIPDCPGALNTSPGVWYWLEGTGTVLTASLCNDAATFDSKLTVYRGTCEKLECVAGNSDACGAQAEVTWLAEAGVTYYILVHGAAGSSGPFQLDILIRVGDLDCDGRVNAADIGPFVLAYTDPAGYASQFPDCQVSRADLTGDGNVDEADLVAFIDLLIGG